MRRIEVQDNWSGDLPTVILYRQDIDEIFALFQSRAAARGKNDAIIIKSGDYLFDSLDELKREQGDAIDRLGLKTPTLELEINGRHVSMGGLDTAEGKKIHAILRSRRRRLGFILQGPAVLMSIGGGVLLVLTLGLTIVGMTRNVAVPAVAIFAAITATPWILPPRARVLLIRRHEHQTFWTRHAADFIKAGIGLSGTVVGYAARVVQEYYSKHP